MLDDRMRPIKENLLKPLAGGISRFCTPNQISFAGFITGLISAILAAGNILLAGFIFWILNRILDGLDGVVARETGRQTDLGGYLDLMYDLIVYIAIPLAFVYQGVNSLQAGSGLYWAALALFGSFYINLGSWSLLSALLEKRMRENADRAKLTSLEMPWGIVEGTETVVFYSFFYIIPCFNTTLFGVFAFLTLLGAVVRIIWGVRNLKE